MALDLRPDHFAEGDFAPVSVARTPGMVLREGGDRFLHLFGAGFAHYVWTVFVDAARHLGGRAVGVTALEAATSTEQVAHA
jgi:sarcosine oxidase gamma subunit